VHFCPIVFNFSGLGKHPAIVKFFSHSFTLCIYPMPGAGVSVDETNRSLPQSDRQADVGRK
jgi:hypothetical protein